MINKKYICFSKVNECAIKYALMLQRKTNIIPLFKAEDVTVYKLPYQSCENVEEQEDVFYVENDFSVFHSIGIYNEHCALLQKIRELREREINILIANVPTVEDISRQLTADEVIRIENDIGGFSVPKKRGDVIEVQLKKIYGKENYNLYREGEIANLQQYYRGNECVLKDQKGEFANVSGGLRITTNVPSSYINSIFFLGPCVVGGMYCKDNETIPSVVQRLLNINFSEEYLVINYGTCGFYRSYIEKINKLSIRRGDLIVIIDCFHDIARYRKDLYKEINIELTKLYDSTQTELFFEMPIHMGARGNQEVAKYIYPYIAGMCNRSEEREMFIKYADKNIDQDLLDIDLSFYQDEAEKLEIKYALSEKHNGAIVMNCNPFTNGHKYLIEMARKQVNNLIVFVVEEDKSYFTFKDRKRMVELGTEQYDNVIVISSGKLVLSCMTLPEYFSKDSLQEVIVNPIKDVEIFAQNIAPIFNVSCRFIGEEPIDKVSAQYNRTIKEICPKYGIEVEEIPRKRYRGKVISASDVRKLLQTGRYEEIRELVPESTWRYLNI